MTPGLFRALISLSTFLIIIIYFFKLRSLKGRKNVSWDIKQGLRCYSCKQELIVDDGTIQMQYEKLDKLNKVFNRLEKDPKSNDVQMCTCCKRDNLINDVTGKNVLLNKIKLLIVKKPIKILWIYSISMFSFLILDIIDYSTNKNSIRIFFFLYNLVIFTYWAIMFYRFKLDYIKEENPSN